MDQPRRRLSAVWFADIVGYTELSSRNEPAALHLVSILQALARTIVEHEFEGRVVKYMGDAVLAEFSSTDSAVRAAATLQERYIADADKHGQSSRLRIGVHLGEVTATPDGDLYGDGINTAARLQKEAAPGQVIISEDVWRQLRQRPEFRFESLGAVDLRGITTRVQVFNVLFGARAALAQPAAPAEPPSATRRWRPATIGALTVIGLAALAAVILPRDAHRVEPASVVPDAGAKVAAERSQVSPEAARASPEVARVMSRPSRPATDSPPAGEPLVTDPVRRRGVAPDDLMAIRTLLEDFSAALSAENPASALRRLFRAAQPSRQARAYAGLRQQFGPDVETRLGRFENRGAKDDTLNIRFVVLASSSTRQETPVTFEAQVVRTPDGPRFAQVASANPGRLNRPADSQ